MTNYILEDGLAATHLASTRYNLCRLENRETILGQLDNQDEIYLIHERDNFYDEYAVAVYYKDYKLGYIPRKINEEVSCYLDLFHDYQIEVTKINVVDIDKYIEIIFNISFVDVSG
jgi:hypothetical protein